MGTWALCRWRTPPFQWRSQKQRPHLGSVWTLPQEEHFGDFWADQVPQLQAQGWAVVVQPGFAHESVPVERWKLILSPDTGEVLGKELDSPLVKPARGVEKLALPGHEGEWLLSLGIEIDGETLDLAPMLANLIKRDPRWLIRNYLDTLGRPGHRVATRAGR